MNWLCIKPIRQKKFDRQGLSRVTLTAAENKAPEIMLNLGGCT